MISSTTQQDEVNELKVNAGQGRAEIKAKEEGITELSNRISGEFDVSLKAAKATEEKCSKELVKLTSSWQNSKKVVKAAEEDIRAAKEPVVETKDTIIAKGGEITRESDCVASEKWEADEAEKKHE